jgi:U2-associated protein SR140
LTIEDVKFQATSANSEASRKASSAIVTLAAETPATDIDTMVSHLQNKYLGFGFNLSISRYLSSAALTGAFSSSAPMTSIQNLPFGAKPIQQHTPLSRAPPPGQGPGRFAPPASYTSSTPYSSRTNQYPQSQISVLPPNDLRTLKLIHKTVEALLTHGPEFEALLMSRPQIQRDEQWAWLWNSSSTGGVYYRWRLWEVLTGAKTRQKRLSASAYANGVQSDVLFEGQSTWKAPEENLKFEYVTKIDEFISDEDYDSSDEEDMDEGGGLARRYQDHQRLTNAAVDSVTENDGTGYLNPLAKAKLVHLLTRLPESNAKLRKGDVARVTGFAIQHAGSGAGEIAALITRNVIDPFSQKVRKAGENVGLEGNSSNDEGTQNRDQSQAPNDVQRDTTPSSLVGLYIISDILSSSASSGVRHAWRYRSVFETQLRLQSVFPVLGRAERKYNWGKLKAEKWKRSVQGVLALWEGWCVFAQPSHDAFVEGFLQPPLTSEEKLQAEQREEKAKLREEMDKEKTININRWRSVDESEDRVHTSIADLESKPMDVDENPMPPDDDDEAFVDENIDGVSMADSSDEETQIPDVETPAQPEVKAVITSLEEAPAKSPKVDIPQNRRSRPRAADFDDMFE